MSAEPNNDPAWLREKAAIEDVNIPTAGDVEPDREPTMAEQVQKIFYECFLLPAEISADGSTPLVPFIEVQGIRQRFGFHPDRVTKNAPAIKELLDRLPDAFSVTGGGGWSFLNACVTKDDMQWGEHQNMEQLLCLGLASGYATYVMPREMWKILPGGMPYFMTHPERLPVALTEPKAPDATPAPATT